MTPAVERLFHELADLAPDEQEKRLRESSADDSERGELRQLLLHDRRRSQQDSPTLAGVIGNAAERAIGGFGGVGDMAGSYRLVKELGRGGMGAVFLGERADGAVDQVAAIKLIGPQAAHLPFVVDRFLRERRIQASLSHPNIARILDAGVTAGGAPYLAMEYCDGEPIDVHCRRNQLGAAGVVKLLLPVCEAVSHAHRHMIIHRDLKPSNILVDGDGRPKLLDFGIAKVLENGAETEQTRTAAPMLTLHYASPEQVRGEPITASSDVFSLGAVMYRLLTGHFAHETPNELALPQAILETDPTRPSEWNPAIRGDLENIILMALRREPARRYPSVEALAEDLRRFLDRRPVLATPPSLLYRTGRFVARNPGLTAASALALLSLVGGTALSIQQARRAQRNLADVRSMANVFLFDFEKSIRNIPGTLAARHKVIETARTYLEKIAPQAGNDTALLREVADAYRSLAEVQRTADFTSKGEKGAVLSLERSRALRRQLGDHQSMESQRLLPYIETTAAFCLRAASGAGQEPAREACGEALRLADQWTAREPSSLDALRAIQSVAMSRTRMLEADGHLSEARAAGEQAYRTAAELTRRLPGDTDALNRVLMGAVIHANLLMSLKRFEDALEPAQTGAAAGERLLSINPYETRWRLNTATILRAVGSAHRGMAEQGKPDNHLDEAARYLEKSLRYSAEDVRRDPSDNTAKDSFVTAAGRLARLYETQRRLSEALDMVSQARDATMQLLAGDPTSRRYLYLIGFNRVQAADLLEAMGRLGEADTVLAESESWLRKLLAIEANDAIARSQLISACLSRARVAGRLGNRGRAHEEWRAAMAEAEDMIRKDPSAKKYISDYEDILSLGRKWGLLPPRQQVEVR